ncbi:FMN-binding negative transcriptional regulator [Paenirhodobacter hankyongi]|uniref:FMN-binding negative transcriptional regulator n=1 Tax=Paenirhodobacter hankyongi TaxID=2294033 RepID=UPI002482D71E|nr:FMN-binding negative transcriptional regulator [Sinirhodobacter hankyongi]
MYVPLQFQELDLEHIAALIEVAPLACIVAQTEDGLIANHIPVLRAPDGALIGHVATANPMHRLIPEGGRGSGDLSRRGCLCLARLLPLEARASPACADLEL